MNTLPLDSYKGCGHRFECKVYVNNNSTNRPFICNGALFSFNSNAQSSGLEIGIYSSQLCIVSRDNVSSDSIFNIAALSSIINQWLTIQYDIKKISSASFSAVVKVFKADGTNICQQQYVMQTPLNTNRNNMVLFCDNYGWFSIAQNIYDFIKDIKIFRETDLNDFSS